jgi:menaquinone-dependent protoporphyrinogen oxidase
MTVLVTAASEHGATGEIAGAIARTLRGHDLSVALLAPQEVTDVQEYDAVVLGSAVYAGHWLTPAKDLPTPRGRRADAVRVRADADGV